MSNAPPTASGGAASKAFLVAAIVLGVLATVLAFAFIQSSAGADRGPVVTIVVAKRDLTPAMKIDPDRDLKQEQIPARWAALAQRSLSWEARAGYKDLRVNRDIFQDQPVTLGDIAAVGQLVLEPPYSAITVPAEPGMIIPGDNVKIIIASPAAQSATIQTATTRPQFNATIIGPKEGYKVLAVGGYLFKTRQVALIADQTNSNGANAKTVTLQVTDEQAKEIMSALGTTSTSTKATLLLCPSSITMPPGTGVTVTPGATTKP